MTTTEKKPRTPRNTREMTVTEAVAAIVELRRSITDKEAAILLRVPEEVRGAVRAKADKECDADDAEPCASPFDQTSDPPAEADAEPAGTKPYVPGPTAREARKGR